MLLLEPIWSSSWLEQVSFKYLNSEKDYGPIQIEIQRSAKKNMLKFCLFVFISDLYVCLDFSCCVGDCVFRYCIASVYSVQRCNLIGVMYHLVVILVRFVQSHSKLLFAGG